MKEKFVSEFRVTTGDCQLVECFYDDDDDDAMDYFYDHYSADMSSEFMLFKKMYMHISECIFILWCFIAKFERYY